MDRARAGKNVAQWIDYNYSRFLSFVFYLLLCQACQYPLSAASKVLCLQEHSKRALGIGALQLNRINRGEIAGAHRSMRFDLSVEETTLRAAGQMSILITTGVL